MTKILKKMGGLALTTLLLKLTKSTTVTLKFL